MRPIIFAVAVAVVAACSHNHIQVDDMALGRVVVYRNGVAYFERRAQLSGDELSLSVPRDKVDDFLKSLTVKDARTGKSLPVSFPSAGQEHGGVVDMTIQLPNANATDVILTYITEAPAWKPSYRVVIGDDGQVRLEGWAIVDNTSGEDWRDVLVGVGSSSALSFRYDLWSIRTVQRQTLASEEHFAVAPPRGASPYSESSGGPFIAELGDDDIPRPVTHPDGERWNEVPQGAFSAGLSVESVVVTESSSGSGGESYDRKAMEKQAEQAAREKQRQAQVRQKRIQGEQRVRELAQQLKFRSGNIVIEGNAGANETREEALDRANVLRNQLIDEGVPPAQLSVRAVEGEEGRPAGVRLVADDAAAINGQPGPVDDSPVGESHFQSKTPMSVQRGSSVMVSIINNKTKGEVVYLYDRESARGNSRFAFKAVRLINPTKHTLDTGPVTVYGEGQFIGEGLTDPIPPESTALVPFALDRQVVVESKADLGDRIASLVTLQRGVLTTEVEHTRKTTYKLTNRTRFPVTVFVRHTVADGWKLLDSPDEVERLGRAHLFPVKLAGGQTRTISVAEATPLTKTLDLRSPAALDMVEVYLSDAADNPEFADHMKALLAIYKEMADDELAIESLRDRMDDYRVRMDELHVQIVSLKAVKSGGSLLKHLNKKMKEISERVQDATIELVNHQEHMMMARIRFLDAVAELTIQRGLASNE